MIKNKSYTTVDEYIANYPDGVQAMLQQVRKAIRQAAPEAVESVSYMMPAYKLNGRPLVYFGGYAHHIGFYAVPTGIAAFKRELAGYKTSKGAVQFPLDEPMPLDLITRMVKYRVRENMEKGMKKSTYGSKST